MTNSSFLPQRFGKDISLQAGCSQRGALISSWGRQRLSGSEFQQEHLTWQDTAKPKQSLLVDCAHKLLILHRSVVEALGRCAPTQAPGVRGKAILAVQG